MKEILLQREVINVSYCMEKLGTESDGAVVAFSGRARDNSSYSKNKVSYLEYEIYEGMAARELDKIAEEALEKWSLNDCIIIHRYGRVEIGEVSIFIGVSSPHRDDAYEASQYIIDTIKKSVPIWKTEFYSDGTSRVFDRSQ